MNIKFWKYWTILVLVVFALATGQYYFGLFDFILSYDQTYLTFVNIAIGIIAHIMLAKMHLKRNNTPEEHQMIRYMGETTVAIGLVGTLIGFMIVLWSVFGTGVALDPTDTVMMTQALANMAAGMAAALITSLSGIITSTIIGLQLVVLEE